MIRMPTPLLWFLFLSLTLGLCTGCGTLGGEKEETVEPERSPYRLGGREEKKDEGWMKEKWSTLKNWEDRHVEDWYDRVLSD